MSDSISESVARDALAKAGSPASDPSRYSAKRHDGGWAFSWSSTEPVSIGSSPWVVSDSKQVRRVGIGERAVDALADLNKGQD